MDPNKIAQMLASGDPEQVKAAQTQLQASGFPVKPDGKLGPSTSQAMANYKTAYDQQQAVERQQSDRQAATQQAEAEARAAEARAREAEQDPTNRLTKLATEVGPYAVGGVGGYALSRGMKSKFDEKDAAQADAVSRISRNRSIAPQQAEQQVNRLARDRTVRSVRQFGVPAAFLGASEFTRDVIAPQFEDPGTREAINLVATGEQGAGITLAAKQLYDMATRGNPIDPEDEALIRSRANPPAPPSGNLPPPPGGGNAPPPPQAPQRHSDRLRQAATVTGAKPGRNKAANVEAIRRNLTAENIPQVAEALNLPKTADRRAVLQRLREISNIGGKMALPLMAAGAAYLASGSPSEASTGGEAAPSTGDRLTAAGATGATAYGVNKLLNAVPTAGGPMTALAPMTFDPFEGGSEEDTRHNIMAARGDLNALLPSAGRAIGVTPQEQSAYEMAQVPTPSPSRVQRQADTRQDAEYMRRYLDDEPVNMPVSVPGWQDRAATAPDPFDADLAELASLLAELEGPAEPQRRSAPVVMPNPVMVSPALQNRLLAGR